jgi:hypothetical protein
MNKRQPMIKRENSVHPSQYDRTKVVWGKAVCKDSMERRYRPQYEYPDGKTEVLVMARDPMPMAFGITPPYVKDGAAPKKGWSVNYGPRGISTDEAGEFVYPPGVPESVKAYFAMVNDIDKLGVEFIQADAANSGMVVTHKYPAIRSWSGKQNTYDNNMVHAKFNMAWDKTVTPNVETDVIATKVHRVEGPIVPSDKFERVRCVSKDGISAGQDCFASIHGKVEKGDKNKPPTLVLSSMIHVNTLLMTQNGTDPKDMSQGRPGDYSNIDLPDMDKYYLKDDDVDVPAAAAAVVENEPAAKRVHVFEEEEDEAMNELYRTVPLQ